ncbi:uncharacterized protein LOC130667982 [Microplitis mediator]|uniref:uncharacterized protein LOC130667982 n=1 Tax=Microplitis mediator TaxID=375433 RepID=UPI002553CCBE|nr:uncharacterized protein LOC130667982 [Microplitis mediator]
MNDILGERSRKRRYNHVDTDNSLFDGENCHIPICKRIKLEQFDDEESEEILHTQDLTYYNYLSESDVKQENIYDYDNNIDTSDDNRTETSDIDEGIQSYCSETYINKSCDIQNDIRNWGSTCGVNDEDINKLFGILKDKQVFFRNKSINESEVSAKSATSSEFEKKILEEVKNIKNYQEENFNKLLNKINNKYMGFGSEDEIRRNWFREYNLFLPMSTTETFDNFCKLLNQVKEFEQKFMTFVEVIAKPNERHTLPQKIGVILKKLITREVVVKLWVVRSKEGKVTLSNTKFYDCLLDYFKPQLKANKKKPSQIRTEFNVALRCAIANAKDWGNKKAKNRQSQ